jgi:hypothetical protein
MSYTTEQTIQTLIPFVRWHQTSDNLFIFFDVHNMIDNKKNNIDIQNNKIIFDIQSNSGTNYYISLELYDTIDVKKSIYIIEEKYIKMDLVKSNSLSWNSLLKDKNMYKNNIKVNWQNWDDSDDDNDDIQNQSHPQNPMGGNQQFDFHKMMESMGGIGNMGEMLKNMNLGNVNDEGIDEEENNDDEGNNDDDEGNDDNDEGNNDEGNNDNDEGNDYCYDCNQ